MKGKRYSTEQKIRILRQADQAGVHIVDVCREHGISEQSFHRWKREFGLMELDQAKQLKELQKLGEFLVTAVDVADGNNASVHAAVGIC